MYGDGGYIDKFGLNFKICNISCVYWEVKGDIIWIVDCNVWFGVNLVGRMVDKLDGFLFDGICIKFYKFVY